MIPEAPLLNAGITGQYQQLQPGLNLYDPSVSTLAAGGQTPTGPCVFYCRIEQELVIHAGAGFKSWLRSVFLLCHLKSSKMWRRALVVAIPKRLKPVEDPIAISLIGVPTRF